MSTESVLPRDKCVLPSIQSNNPREGQRGNDIIERKVERKRSMFRTKSTDFSSTQNLTKSIGSEGKKVINQYIIYELIGRGTFGKVKKVYCTETNQYCAMKILNKKLLKRKRIGQFGNALRGVEKEIAIWKKLKHEHIVELKEVIDDEKSPKIYMISEYIEDGPLYNPLKPSVHLRPCVALKYFSQIIDGISYLHFHKIIHRDIKPENILKGRNGCIKLTDFGVSHMYDGEDDCIRKTAGTAAFMAPETLTGENFHGQPIDIWAAGVTLFMFIYGRTPFVADTIPELYKKIQNDEIIFERTMDGEKLDPNLINLLHQILEKDPTKRLNVDEIMNHPWLEKSNFTEDHKDISITPIDVKVAITPITFVGACKVKEIAHKMVLKFRRCSSST